MAMIALLSPPAAPPPQPRLSRLLLLLLLRPRASEGQPAVPAWPGSVFYADVSAAPAYAFSGEVLANMKRSAAAGAGAARGLAWGSTTGDLQTDTSIMPLRLPAGGKKTCAAIAGRAAAAGARPDCDDTAGLLFPLPEGGAIEGTAGYGACKGDCHLLVHDEASGLLFESYASSVAGGVLTSACVVVWDLQYKYPSNLRGDQCTSTDAAGFPVAPLLATADEVAGGAISHALRFALPNDMLQHHVYAHPATHAGVGNPGGGPDHSPFYGMRLRLRSNVTAAVRAAAVGQTEPIAVGAPS
eukprot:SAG22_NODE_930_length_6462_cov_4.402326_4_plen_299_part_00